MWRPASRLRQCAGRALFVLFAVLANDARGAAILKTSPGQQRERVTARSSDGCVSAAAGLAPCLTVDTPLSGLTTAEEAICCESLREFEQGGCFCLGGVSGWTAYDRRVAGLAAAYERCSAETISCPVSVIGFEENAPMRAERRSPVRSSTTLHGSKASKGRHLNISIRDRSFSEVIHGDSEVDDSVDAAVTQDSLLSLTVGGIPELAAVLEGNSKAQVKISLEVTVDVGETVSGVRDVEKYSMLGHVWARALAQPVLYGSLTVAVLAFVFLCFLRSRDVRECESDRSSADERLFSSCYCQTAKSQQLQ